LERNFPMRFGDFMLFVAYFVPIYVSPKSPPWNAIKLIRIFENMLVSYVDSCSSGSRVRLRFQVGGEKGI
jgi:hypothetical protein